MINNRCSIYPEQQLCQRYSEHKGHLIGWEVRKRSWIAILWRMKRSLIQLISGIIKVNEKKHTLHSYEVDFHLSVTESNFLINTYMNCWCRWLLECLVDWRQHLNACRWGKCRSWSCENTRHAATAVVWSFRISQVFHLVSCVDGERYAELESEADGVLMGWMCEDPVTVLMSGSSCMSSLFSAVLICCFVANRTGC